MRIASKRTLGIGLVIAAAVAAGGFISMSRPVVVVAATTEQNVPVRVFGLGTVEAQVISKLGLEVGAAIVEIKVDHGDTVKKGAVLARLHDAEQVAKVAKARAGVASAEVAIRKAEANLAKTQAILSQKSQVNRRRQELAGRQTVSVQTAEEAQKDEDVAKADLAVATADIEVLKATLADASAQASFEQIMLAHHTLEAPFDGMVVERLKEVGTVIKAGDPIITLVAPETVWILAYIEEARAGPVAVGQKAEIRLRSLPQQRFEGRVVRIGIESDRVTEERRVWVKCGSCPAAFHLGEQAEVLIHVATLPSARLVPEAAVQGFDGRSGKVWTVEGGRIGRRTLRFGLRTEDARLVVAEELPASVAIVGTPVAGLSEGRAARLVEANTP